MILKEGYWKRRSEQEETMNQKKAMKVAGFEFLQKTTKMPTKTRETTQEIQQTRFLLKTLDQGKKNQNNKPKRRTETTKG